VHPMRCGPPTPRPSKDEPVNNAEGARGAAQHPSPTVGGGRYGRCMNFPRRLRETVDCWAATHPGSRLEKLAVNFFIPKDGPGDVVMVVIVLEARDTDVNQMREIRNHIARIGRQGAVGPIVVHARTLDSEIVVTGRRTRMRQGDGDG
jgi:hypothetical protein